MELIERILKEQKLVQSCINCHRETNVQVKGNEYYAKIHEQLSKKYGVEQLTAAQSEEMWADNKDMSGELLSKVKRQNKIMVEFKGSATISRTD